MTTKMDKSSEQVTVETGGGDYVGIQDGKVYFNDPNPQTKTTLTLSLEVLTSDAVKNRIEESRAEFAKAASKK